MKARRAAVVITLLCAPALTACSTAEPSTSTSSSAPLTPPSASVGTPAPDPSGQPPQTPNDLPNGRAARTVKVGRLTVKADYATPLPLDRWTPAVPKPITLSITAYVSRDRRKKVYLSRVTIYPSSADDQGDLGSLDPIVDSAAISPGYLVTSPTSYGWRVVIPGVNASSRTLSLDVRYEMLLYQGGNNPRDYSKQTVTDTLAIPLR